MEGGEGRVEIVNGKEGRSEEQDIKIDNYFNSPPLHSNTHARMHASH